MTQAVKSELTIPVDFGHQRTDGIAYANKRYWIPFGWWVSTWREGEEGGRREGREGREGRGREEGDGWVSTWKGEREEERRGKREGRGGEDQESRNISG
jgi:hypothetical protein